MANKLFTSLSNKQTLVVDRVAAQGHKSSLRLLGRCMGKGVIMTGQVNSGWVLRNPVRDGKGGWKQQ